MLCFLEAPEKYNPGCTDLQGGESETEKPFFSFWEDNMSKNYNNEKSIDWKSTQ